MAHRLHQFAKRFARHIDVAEQFAASVFPTLQATCQYSDLRVAQALENARGGKAQVFSSRIAPVHHDGRIAPRNARPSFLFDAP